MLVQNIHHVAIVASDYEKSKDFYVNKLGFQVIQEEFREVQKDIKLEVKLGNVSAVRVIYDGKELERSNSQRVVTLRFPPAE